MGSVQTIRMGYLDNADRLLLDFVCPATILSMQATRRITRRLIHGLARLLTQSSPVMARVPGRHQMEVMVWEHWSALQPEGAPSGAAAQSGAGAERPPPPWPLLEKVDIDTLPAGFRFRFTTEDGVALPLEMTRPDLHRLLASLRTVAHAAEWNLESEVAWLVEADSPLHSPGSLAS